MTSAPRKLEASTVKLLGWLAEYGFSYYKSYRHFRMRHANGFSYIGINATARNRRLCVLSFQVGTRIDSVEAMRRQLSGCADMELSHRDRTLLFETADVGPADRPWEYAIPGAWTIGEGHGVFAISYEVQRILKDLVLSYALIHRDPKEIRNTLLESPGRSSLAYPYESVLIIDTLYLPGRLQDDIATLRLRYARSARDEKLRYENFVAKLLNGWPSA